MSYRTNDYVRFLYRSFPVIGLVEEAGAAGVHVWPQSDAPGLPSVVRKALYVEHDRILHKDVKLRFGKYAGHWLGDCPDDYLLWLVRQGRIRSSRTIPRLARTILRSREVALPAWEPVSRQWFDEQQAELDATGPYARPEYAKRALWDARDDQDLVYVQDESDGIRQYRIDVMNGMLLFTEQPASEREGA